jgi:23S rRNA maturation mini-RNase III
MVILLWEPLVHFFVHRMGFHLHACKTSRMTSHVTSHVTATWQATLLPSVKSMLGKWEMEGRKFIRNSLLFQEH